MLFRFESFHLAEEIVVGNLDLEIRKDMGVDSLAEEHRMDTEHLVEERHTETGSLVEVLRMVAGRPGSTALEGGVHADQENLGKNLVEAGHSSAEIVAEDLDNILEEMKSLQAATAVGDPDNILT